MFHRTYEANRFAVGAATRPKDQTIPAHSQMFAGIEPLICRRVALPELSALRREDAATSCRTGHPVARARAATPSISPRRRPSQTFAAPRAIRRRCNVSFAIRKMPAKVSCDRGAGPILPGRMSCADVRRRRIRPGREPWRPKGSAGEDEIARSITSGGKDATRRRSARGRVETLGGGQPCPARSPTRFEPIRNSPS